MSAQEIAWRSPTGATERVDLRPVFAGSIADYADAGGILPNDLGSEASARAIWSVMQERCIAQ